ncbi:putative membrane protein [Enterobacter hormaechei]|nr:putative membrane protein [Enterobacter hormaechei]
MVSFSCPTNAYAFFVVLLQDYHGIGSLYSTQFIRKCFSSVPELMIFSRGYFFCYLVVFTKF